MNENARKDEKANSQRPQTYIILSYKLYMSLLKEEIEKHLKTNNVTLEIQAGLSEGVKVEDDLFTAILCRKVPLIVVLIDFSKAYDS